MTRIVATLQNLVVILLLILSVIRDDRVSTVICACTLAILAQLVDMKGDEA